MSIGLPAEKRFPILGPTPVLWNCGEIQIFIDYNGALLRYHTVSQRGVTDARGMFVSSMWPASLGVYSRQDSGWLTTRSVAIDAKHDLLEHYIEALQMWQEIPVPIRDWSWIQDRREMRIKGYIFDCNCETVDYTVWSCSIGLRQTFGLAISQNVPRGLLSEHCQYPSSLNRGSVCLLL